MKTFEDLVFQEHAIAKEAKKHNYAFPDWLYKDSKHAVLLFDNGYGISVIKDCPFLTGVYNYECAVIKGTETDYHLVYPGFMDNDVMRMNTKEAVNELMEKIQELPNQKD